MIQQGKDTHARLFPLALVALAALYLLTHPFAGFTGDAQIYMGRALADNDPAGIGRDLMFRLDGQSAYSLFPRIAAFLVSRLGLLDAALLLVAVSSLLWFCGALAIARAATPQRWLSVACVLILAPTAYGAFNLFHVGEGLAIPRPFAEGLVLLAVATFLSGHRVLAFAPLVAAGLFHPIMALGGAAVLVLCLCFEDRRGFVVLAVAAVLLLIAAFMGLPLVDRLRATIDADWLELLQRRHKYLFPHLWPQTAWTLPAVQAITILIAARRVSPALRRLLLAALVCGMAGVGVSYLSGRFDPALLVMQAQFWRMWWLTGVLSALSLGLVALNATDNGERLSVAILALAWCLWQDAGIYAPAVAALALLVSTLRLPVSQDVSRAIWLGAAVAVVAPVAIDLPALRFFAAQSQPDFMPAVLPLALKFLGPPLLLGAIALAVFGPPASLERAPLAALGIATVALCALAGLLWNDATSFDKRIGDSARRADLEKLMPQAQGEVLWLHAVLEPWVWLGRPNWSGDMQVAGAVFSRDLAMLYRDRARALIASGLRDETIIDRVPYRPKGFHPPLTKEGVVSICARPDAPSYIVAPVKPGAPLDPALNATLWTPPYVRAEMLFTENSVEFPRFDSYAIIDCSRR
ncbi:MAG: hypothetical protein U1E28_22580 [Beijerinckiaceae bacterium]